MDDTMLLFPAALDLVTAQVDATGPQEWNASSPCAGWSALDVLEHVTGTVLRALTSMGGGAYESLPAEAVGGAGAEDVVARWREAAGQTAEALVTADLRQVVPSPRGDVPIGEALALPAADLAVHAWDIAAAGGRSLELPEDLRAHVRRVVASVPEDRLRQEGLLGPEVQAPASASETEQLMAFLGRRRP